MKIVKGAVVLALGAVVSWIGYALWRSPHLDWDSFLESGGQALEWVWNQVDRMATDPLAWVGLLVLIVGLAVVVVGLRRLRTVIFE